METVKPIKKQRNSNKTMVLKKSKGVAIDVKVPDEEEIREKAVEIYQHRIAVGEAGTAEDDWQKAEEYFKSSSES